MQLKKWIKNIERNSERKNKRSSRKSKVISYGKIFIKIMFFIVLSTLISCSNINKQQIDISPNDVIPTSVQVEYQQMETLVLSLHS